MIVLAAERREEVRDFQSSRIARPTGLSKWSLPASFGVSSIVLTLTTCSRSVFRR